MPQDGAPDNRAGPGPCAGATGDVVFALMDGGAPAWTRCNVCKKPIAFGSLWYRCSVSTCNKKRLPLHFCSPDCWDAHVPDANHKNPLCIEEKAPFRA